jgi:hypothetical protein
MIRSNYRDYYDFAIPNAFADIHWERNLEEVTVALTEREIDFLFEMARNEVEIVEKRKYGNLYSQKLFPCICFCGKLYPYWILDESILFRHEFPWTGTIKTRFFPIPKEEWGEFGIHKAPDAPYRESLLIDKIHKEIDSPVFLFYRGYKEKVIEIIKNPPLSVYGFQDVLSPVQACQELMMYLPRLKQEPEPLPIADELKAKMAGHGKRSFTQGTPGAKKEQRRLNKQKKRLAR